MKIICVPLAAAALLLAAAAPAAAQPELPADEVAAARDVLEAMSTRTMFPRVLDGLMSLQEADEELPPRVRKMIRDFMEEHFTWEKLEPEFIRMYVDIYTLDELRGLAAFYRTPLGRRVVETMPELSRRSQQVGMDAVNEFLPRLMEAVMGEALEELGEDGERPAKEPRQRRKS
ncbi:MAG TPA: DUF2059 domain-containing protein [Longimicrobium sp.]|nr:DUF2059 domain-containing protein [Longimicrobium sp.]